MTVAPYLSTLVAPPARVLPASAVDTFTQRLVASGSLIDKVVSLDARAVDVFFIPAVTQDDVVARTNALFPAIETGCDILTQPAASRFKKLLIADMESTMIEQEMLDEWAARIGVGAFVADITRRAMNGELDFAAALSERVALFKGQPVASLEAFAAHMTLMPGAADLMAVVKRAGGKAWLVSGGFKVFVEKIAANLGFDAFFANDLIVEKGRVSGRVALPVLDKNSKKTLMEKACATYACGLEAVAAVGDGANDIPMLLACHQGGGLGVAYHAKPAVRALIPNQISCGDLSALVYALGGYIPK